MIKAQDIENIVKKLNYELYDKMQSVVEEYGIFAPLELCSNGDSIAVKFLDVYIWCSEDDPEDPFEEETPKRKCNSKARLEKHLRDKINDLVTKLSEIKL